MNSTRLISTLFKPRQKATALYATQAEALQHKVYVSMLNSKSVEKTMQGLKDSAGFMRSQVARMVNLRITPELVFEYDDSIEHGERIDNILKQISEQDKAIKEKK